MTELQAVRGGLKVQAQMNAPRLGGGVRNRFPPWTLPPAVLWFPWPCPRPARASGGRPHWGLVQDIRACVQVSAENPGGVTPFAFELL